MEIRRLILLAVLVIGLPVKVMAQGGPTAAEINEANNPLTPKITVNLQDYYVADYYGLPDSDSNTFLVRGVLPHKLLGWPQLLRVTAPIVTSPDVPLGSETGLGDINVIAQARGRQYPGQGSHCDLPRWSRSEHGRSGRATTSCRSGRTGSTPRPS